MKFKKINDTTVFNKSIILEEFHSNLKDYINDDIYENRNNILKEIKLLKNNGIDIDEILLNSTNKLNTNNDKLEDFNNFLALCYLTKLLEKENIKSIGIEALKKYIDSLDISVFFKPVNNNKETCLDVLIYNFDFLAPQKIVNYLKSSEKVFSALLSKECPQDYNIVDILEDSQKDIVEIYFKNILSGIECREILSFSNEIDFIDSFLNIKNKKESINLNTINSYKDTLLKLKEFIINKKINIETASDLFSFLAIWPFRSNNYSLQEFKSSDPSVLKFKDFMKFKLDLLLEINTETNLLRKIEDSKTIKHPVFDYLDFIEEVFVDGPDSLCCDEKKISEDLVFYNLKLLLPLIYESLRENKCYIINNESLALYYQDNSESFSMDNLYTILPVKYLNAIPEITEDDFLDNGKYFDINKKDVQCFFDNLFNIFVECEAEWEYLYKDFNYKDKNNKTAKEFIDEFSKPIKNKSIKNKVKSLLEKKYLLGEISLPNNKFKQIQELAISKGLNIDDELDKLMEKISKLPNQMPVQNKKSGKIKKL